MDFPTSCIRKENDLVSIMAMSFCIILFRHHVVEEPLDIIFYFVIIAIYFYPKNQVVLTGYRVWATGLKMDNP